MATEWETHDGILLKAIPYLGTKRILKVFTPQKGMLSLFATHQCAPFSVFCRAEWVIRTKSTELQSLQDASLTDPLEQLRTNFTVLSAAGGIAADLLRTELPHRPAPHLFELLLACFKHLPRYPSLMGAAFRLKLLKAEGLLEVQPQCAHCERAASLLWQGESVCSVHGISSAFTFSQEEWEQLAVLTHARRFSEFEGLLPSPRLLETIAKLFEERLRH